MINWTGLIINTYFSSELKQLKSVSKLNANTLSSDVLLDFIWTDSP